MQKKNYVMGLREKIGHGPLITVGSSVLVFNEKNELLLQHRTDTDNWGLPGGAMEPGETLEEVATRELFEETNLRCTEFEFVKYFSGERFYFQYPNGDETYSVIALFKALRVEGALGINDGESFALKYFPVDNFPQLEKRCGLILAEVKNFLKK